MANDICILLPISLSLFILFFLTLSLSTLSLSLSLSCSSLSPPSITLPSPFSLSVPLLISPCFARSPSYSLFSNILSLFIIPYYPKFPVNSNLSTVKSSIIKSCPLGLIRNVMTLVLSKHSLEYSFRFPTIFLQIKYLILFYLTFPWQCLAISKQL